MMKKYFKPIPRAVPPPAPSLLDPVVSHAADTLPSKNSSVSDPDQENRHLVSEASKTSRDEPVKKTESTNSKGVRADNSTVSDTKRHFAPIFSNSRLVSCCIFI